jgi:hypothetical protein
MPKLILAVAAALVRRPAAPREVASNPGWLGRHSSRHPHAARKPHEPYVDLSPLDLTRRH